MWRRIARRSPRPSASTFFSRNHTSPDVGSTSRSSVRAVVVLPLPDSPTSPKVSPASMSKLTSSTARTNVGRDEEPRRRVKCFERCRTSTSGMVWTSRSGPAPWARAGVRPGPCAVGCTLSRGPWPCAVSPCRAWQAVQWVSARTVGPGTWWRSSEGALRTSARRRSLEGGFPTAAPCRQWRAGVLRRLVPAWTRAARACRDARAR